MTNAPHARGQRAGWSALPAHIVAAIEAELGSAIISTQSMTGGYSPGVAARVETASGRRAFVKAASSRPNAITPAIHRREILVASHLPQEGALPVPRLLWSLDEGHPRDENDPWVVLVYESIEGHEPAQPWVSTELDRVIAALNDLSAKLTPSPVDAALIGTAANWGPIRTNLWRFRAEDPPAALAPWCRRHLDLLSELSDGAVEAVSGDTLLHFDLQADNMLLTDDRVSIVDWPHARVGAAWLDPLFMAPSVTMHGGPAPEDFLARFASARDVDPGIITAALSSVAGFFTSAALEPEEPGLPGLRAFQEAQAVVARRWLAQRTGWD
ncbi:MAG: phosphotransferase [Thermomicrobiales bacterium]